MIKRIEEAKTFFINNARDKVNISHVPLIYLVEKVFSNKEDYILFQDKKDSTIFKWYIDGYFNKESIYSNIKTSKRFEPWTNTASGAVSKLSLEKLINPRRNLVCIINLDEIHLGDFSEMIGLINKIPGKAIFIFEGGNDKARKNILINMGNSFVSYIDKGDLSKAENVLIKSKFNKGKSVIFYENNSPILINYHDSLKNVISNISIEYFKNKLNTIENVPSIYSGELSFSVPTGFLSTQEEYLRSVYRNENVVEIVFLDSDYDYIPHKYEGDYFYPSNKKELELLCMRAKTFTSYTCIVVPNNLCEGKENSFRNWTIAKESQNDVAVFATGKLVENLKTWKKNIIGCINTSSIDKDIINKYQNIVIIDTTFNKEMICNISQLGKSKNIICIHVKINKTMSVNEIKQKFELTEKEIEKKVEQWQK